MEKVCIEKLDHFGRGIARNCGKPIFVVNALPNEIVDINITNEKKNFMEGVVTNYIKYSNERVIPKCPYYNECGGCDLMHLNYNNQLKFKENKVKEIMEKFLNYNNIKPIIYDEQYNYRDKVTLQVKNKIGYYRKKSYEIIPIDNCLIAHDNINSIIKKLHHINLNNINKIIIRTTNEENMIVFYLDNKINVDEILKEFKDCVIVTILNNKTSFYGKEHIIANINNYKFVISPESFFQVNLNVMEKLYNKALEYAKIDSDDEILDLYCGTGTIGIWSSKQAKKVLGIEINENSIKDAFINKKINNIDNIDFKIGDTGTVLRETKIKPNIIFIDPPRSGLDNKAMNEIINIYPKKIIYISCDPVTLARDLNILKEKYEIIEITPFDMFPNTYHVECVSLLHRKNSKNKDQI